MNKEKIMFTGYDIQKFSLNKDENIPKYKQGNLNIKKKILKNSEKENLYCLVIELEINTKDATISLTINGYFDIPKNVEDEVKSYFLKVSAPAIVYPYIRTIISDITAFDSGETVILPIINFADFDLNEDEE